MIGSPRAYLSRDRRAITWVSNLNFPQLDTHVIRTSITPSLMAFFALFPTVFKTYENKSITDIFAQKKFSTDISNSEICYKYD